MATATQSRKSAKAAPQAARELPPLPKTQLPFLRGLVSHCKIFDKMISIHVRYSDPTSLSEASTLELKGFDVEAFKDVKVGDDILVEFAPRLRQRKDTGDWESCNVIAQIDWF